MGKAKAKGFRWGRVEDKMGAKKKKKKGVPIETKWNRRRRKNQGEEERKVAAAPGQMRHRCRKKAATNTNAVRQKIKNQTEKGLTRVH